MGPKFHGSSWFITCSSHVHPHFPRVSSPFSSPFSHRGAPTEVTELLERSRRAMLFPGRVGSWEAIHCTQLYKSWSDRPWSLILICMAILIDPQKDADCMLEIAKKSEQSYIFHCDKNGEDQGSLETGCLTTEKDHSHFGPLHYLDAQMRRRHEMLTIAYISDMLKC